MTIQDLYTTGLENRPPASYIKYVIYSKFLKYSFLAQINIDGIFIMDIPTIIEIVKLLIYI